MNLWSPALLLVLHAPTHQSQARLAYSVDLQDTVHHVFGVTLRVPALTANNAIFEFAATAPGTYETMNVGRFVRDFAAFDASGHPIAVKHIGINEWQLDQPERVRTIHYGIIATRDTTVGENSIYAMCGSRLVGDYALINGQAVFGFPRGMQAMSLSVALHFPTTWTMATALPLDHGTLLAESYDQLVDSPILIGRNLSVAAVDVTGVPVQIVVHSAGNRVQANELRDAMRGMLTAAGAFMGKLPVNRYVFLYDFAEQTVGAWEHSYSSEYVLQDAPYTPALGGLVTDIAAHEFFHVVTPLNIHSEIIEQFNFATPVPSQHLWLYEGVTEWAAHKMQLEGGLKSAPEYLAVIVQKERTDRIGYDTTRSLVELSLTSYSDSGQRQYSNIYQRGAVVADLLDIRLLELSNGARGLQDLIHELSRRYGKHRAFPENGLIDTIVAITAPEIRDFFTRYVAGTERPPLKEYYAKLGIRLTEDDRGLPSRLDLDPNPTPEQSALRGAWMGKPVSRPRE